MREISYHIIHCSDSTHGDVQEIRRWHKAKGWRDIGYHFVIRRDGEIEVGRQLPQAGAHCYGRNQQSIGTCLIGVDSFRTEQFLALKHLHSALKKMFPAVQAVPHSYFSPHKTCPNFDVSEILKGAIR